MGLLKPKFNSKIAFKPKNCSQPMSFISAKMSFCYSIRLFMPDTVAKPYQYFIIIFVLNPLFIQFSLSSSLSLVSQ
jgi:hypothetical protein